MFISDNWIKHTELAGSKEHHWALIEHRVIIFNEQSWTSHFWLGVSCPRGIGTYQNNRTKAGTHRWNSNAFSLQKKISTKLAEFLIWCLVLRQCTKSKQQLWAEPNYTSNVNCGILNSLKCCENVWSSTNKTICLLWCWRSSRCNWLSLHVCLHGGSPFSHRHDDSATCVKNLSSKALKWVENG